MKIYDFIVIWAWFYWLHATRFLWNKGYNVCLLEKEGDAFTQASLINQARVHNWYHYPRSFNTAIKTKEYFHRFVNDFGFAINKDFKKIYAIASEWSKTSAIEFEVFCEKLWVPCKKIDKNLFFKQWIEEAYETLEYAFDAIKIRDFMKEEIGRRSNIDSYYYFFADTIEETQEGIIVTDSRTGKSFCAKTVINATYAGINKINSLFWVDPINIKYELAEMIICNASKNIQPYGITIMDWDFFSVMPFGIWGKFSLSSVRYTPHEESKEIFASFASNKNNYWVPQTNFWKMKEQLKFYLNEDMFVEYEKSLYTTKVVLADTELDDARPTFVKRYPLKYDNSLITIFSWKINTIYEVEDFFSLNRI